jgi:hypothetical protein
LIAETINHILNLKCNYLGNIDRLAWWYISVIPTTQEVEAEGLNVQGQLYLKKQNINKRSGAS